MRTLFSNDLPKGWVWTTLQEISEIILGQSPPSSTYNTKDEGLPFYQGKLEFGKLYPTPRKWCAAPKKIAEKGDIFISIRAPVGSTNICPDKSAVGRGLAAIRLKLNQSAMRKIPVPIPSLTEQEQIVSELERHLSIADELEGTIASELARSGCLRQSILKHAFSGKLVPQDPNDEPASVLSEKIQEKKKPQQPKRRKKTTKSKTQSSDDYPLLALAGALERNDDLIGNVSPVELRGGKGE